MIAYSARIPVDERPGLAMWVELYDFEEEIERGVALLNDRVPGWYNSVSTEYLHLESASSCVLGQLAMTDLKKQIAAINEPHSYYGAVHLLGIDTDRESAKYGFMMLAELLLTVDSDASEVEERQARAWECLTTQWGERIEKLRAEAGTLA